MAAMGTVARRQRSGDRLGDRCVDRHRDRCYFGFLVVAGFYFVVVVVVA